MSLKKDVLNLRKQGFSYKKIQALLNCSKGTISNYCKGDSLGKLNINIKTSDEVIENIKELSKTKSNNEIVKLLNVSLSIVKKYRLKQIKKIITIEEKKKRASIAVINYRKKLKLKAIEYKGNKCLCCKYNKCVSALEFHHLDSTKKEFSLASIGSSKSWENIKIELDKCVLLCANCHREVHEGLIKIEEYL